MVDTKYGGTLRSNRKDKKLAYTDNIHDPHLDQMQDVLNQQLKQGLLDISDLQIKVKQNKDTIDGIAVSGGASVASAVTYDNTTSGLESENVQNAIDELKLNKMIYDCSKGGTIINESLQAAIDSVPKISQKGGIEIVAMIKDNAAEYVYPHRYVLRSESWSNDASLWSLVTTDNKPWFKGRKNRLVNLKKCAQSLYNAIIDIWINSERDEFISDDYYVKLGIFSPNSNVMGEVTSCYIVFYLTNGSNNIVIGDTINVKSQIDRYTITKNDVSINIIIDFNQLDYTDFPSFTEGYGYLVLNQGNNKEYYIISKTHKSIFNGVLFPTSLNELEKNTIKKNDVYTDVNSIAPYLQGVCYDAYLTQAIQNQFGTVLENKFINIYGKAVNDYEERVNNINPVCISGWIPINYYTRNRVIENIYSYLTKGIAGIALYDKMSESNFIGYYTPEKGQEKTTYSISIADVIDSNSDFANAKYFRFTRKKQNFLVQSNQPLLDNLTKGFLKSDGSIYEAETNYLVSDYVLLTDKVKSYTLNGLISYARANLYAIAFYDKNKNIINTAYKDSSDDATSTAPIVCNINIGELAKEYTNASYIRFSFSQDIGLEIKKLDLQKYNKANVEQNKWVLNQFKNVIFVGDSVTQGYVSDYPTLEVVPEASYPTKMGYLVSGWQITNAGRTGDSPADWLKGNSSKGKDAMFSKYDFSDKDLAVIEFGYNGGLYEKDIETEDTNTYCYESIIKKIKEQNPSIEIVLVIPSNGIIVINWSSVVLKLAERNSCKVIDLTEDLHIHLDNKKWHGASDGDGTLDMVHFTKKGYNAKAYLVYSKLINLFTE